jgi:inorganic pyrophosphatase
MTAKPIGVMKMIDQGEMDDKIIAVHAHDPEYAHYDSIDQLPPHRLLELKQFFLDYKSLENKTVEVGKFGSREDAFTVIAEAILLYKSHKAELKKPH